jgi:hypothetical protein
MSGASELLVSQQFQGINPSAPPTSGTVDDDDGRDDEHDGENEAPVREISDATEAPEEFSVDDEDDASFREDRPAADENFGNEE